MRHDPELEAIRSGWWKIFALMSLMVVGAIWVRAEGDISARSNTTLFFAGVGGIAFASYAYFQLKVDLTSRDRLILSAILVSGIIVLALSEGIPGLGGRSVRLSVPAVVAAVMALLGHRSRK